MKRFIALAFAASLLASPALAQECATPEADRAEIQARHMQNVAYILDGVRAQTFARKTGGESVASRLSHMQFWKLPDGENYFVAFYIAGCRAGNFSLPVKSVEENLSMVKPRFQIQPWAASLGVRGS